ncbi:D-amino-acid oxidase [Saccharothrix tamanrassetensis]|uniref:D-amino-acid oxidase n=1 Tax=Saccharothrix tamanrassetensis TaxID=1051531 RepID=A0A841CLG1_9PSEU|nr:FAD-dependent oxidoreductase [Saccharothrix tamanrassetensis]MBB5957930.1 D-amino-acid oxidase [Saccharothrix tamanrassetensis]
MGDVAVVGAGVIGLTCALRLAEAGHRVAVLADRRPSETVSAVAGGLWFPYRAAPVDLVLRWGQVSLSRFRELAAADGNGVYWREGIVLHRSAAPDLSWTAAVPDHRPAEVGELPDGVVSGVVCSLPVVDMPVYLEWLAACCSRVGVAFRHSTVESLDAVPQPTVVVAAGLRSGDLTGDGTLEPVRGQVVRLANPGLTRWVVDDDNPGGMAYVIPRGGDVVCGGTADEGARDLTPDASVERGVLARAGELVPELRNAAVLSRAVGLRPVRPSVRLDRVVLGGRAVISCYGHGGAGVTLSWGCAEDVAELAA